MKNFIYGAFLYVFVFGIPLSVLFSIAEVVILCLWATGIISTSNEPLHYAFGLGMLISPVVMFLLLVKPSFTIHKENTTGFPLWFIAITEKVYSLKAWFLDFYNENYTKKFQAIYSLFHFCFWVTVCLNISDVYNKEIVDIYLMGSLVILIVMMMIGSVYIATAPSNQKPQG